jgi:hypothetical protein
MARLRSNVELCLTVEGVGLLIGGWVFQDDPGRVAAMLHVGARAPSDVAGTWVRLPRPDVVEAFRATATEDACEANRDCGFLALARGIDVKPGAVAGRLELSLAFDRRGALSHQLNPEPIGEPLDPKPLAFLRHNVTAFLGLVRRQQVQGHPSIQGLVDALGSDAQKLAGSADAAPRLGVDLCVFSADEGLLVAGRLSGGPSASTRP